MKLKNAFKQKMHKTKLEFIQNLRRSNAAQPHENKKRYNRKQKHKNKLDE